MGTTADDLPRGVAFGRGGLGGPAGLLGSNVGVAGAGGGGGGRCLVILEEQNEDGDDDVISEEEDKRLMEGRTRRMTEDRSGVNSSRSSTSTECWMSTYKKLRRASELIGASAVAIDNKIEMAMDLVKNHLMFAVREEMEQMRDRIRELTVRNRQLEEENLVLRASATPENLVRIFNSHVHSLERAEKSLPLPPPSTATTTNNNNNNNSINRINNDNDINKNVGDSSSGRDRYESTATTATTALTMVAPPSGGDSEIRRQWSLSGQEGDYDVGHPMFLGNDPHYGRPGRGAATFIPVSPLFAEQVLASSPPVGVPGIHLSAEPVEDFDSALLARPFHFAKQSRFVSTFDPQVSSSPCHSPSSSASPFLGAGEGPGAGNPPRFLLVRPELSPDGRSISWTPADDLRSFILAGHSLQEFAGQSPHPRN